MRPNPDYPTNDYSVEVNLVGRLLNPERISDILGIQPTKAALAGDPRPTCKKGSPYDMGFWSHEVSTQDDLTECRDHHLTCLADAVAPHVYALREAGVERIYFYYTMSSFIGMLNVKFNAETMAKLASMNADLHVSCYDCFDPKHPFWSTQPEAQDGAARPAE